MSEQDHIDHNRETEEAILRNVKEYGCHIAFLEGDGYLPAFVYTIGLYKTYQHPEIIVFGLKPELMQHLINHVSEALKKGETFKPNQDYDGFLDKYPIQFLEVEKDHYVDYLGYGGWFYDHTFDFPTYQLVWTDKQGRYPWEADFFEDWKRCQPLLDRNTDFKFYEERNVCVYTTKATLDGQPILRVYHNEDGDWQFHSEEDPKIEDAVLVSLESLVKADPTLNELYYLNYGQSAERSDVEAEWTVFDAED